MTTYFLENLIKVETRDFVQRGRYVYKKEKRFLFFLLQEQGFYDTWGFSDIYLGMEAPKNHKLKDGIVFEKPKVILFFHEGDRVEQHFESISDALVFSEKLYSRLKKTVINIKN